MGYFKQNIGFTLIELIVVISLISLILFIAIPRFQSTVFTDNTKKTSRWIIGKVQSLKTRAVRDQNLYILNVDMDSNSMWVTHASMTEDELQNASQNTYQLPGDVRVLEVEYPHDNKIEGGRADIYFYAKGYSDMAIIHIENSDSEQFSFRIEPFLQQVKMFPGYVGFED
ncbi:MAG: type II secretion system protein [Candidatus Desulfatibia sp.]|uniref:pilus assembly FimT family protein n=1 Tax=Candidatus Desulfatibia sp. TaxID=3101189 RepID=UPI002F305C50